MKIYTDIPLPSKKTAAASKYEFDKLTEVGQSMFVALNDGEDAEKARQRVAGSAIRWRKVSNNIDVKFAYREAQDPETGLPAIGVWRIA
jgi:hypothetical protein